MATFGNYVQSVTQDKIIPSVIDGILSGNVLTYRLLGNGKRWDGEALKKPMMYQKNSSGGSYSGMDTLSTAQVATRVLFNYDPRQWYQSVVLSNLDLAVNNTQSRVLSLLQVEMETAKLSMMDDIGTAFYADGTGNSSKEFNGLANLVDDGSVTSTIGGLTRTDYSTALTSDVTTSVGALTTSQMATTFDAVKIGSDSPTLIVTTPTVWSYYEALLQPTVRANYDALGYPQVGKRQRFSSKAALNGEIGFDALMYRGTPVVSDEKCTAGYMYFLNEKYLEWYGLKHPQHGEVTVKVNNIQTNALDEYTPAVGCAWSGLKEPVNQDAEIGQIFLYGNLVNWSPRHQGVLQGITS